MVGGVIFTVPIITRRDGTEAKVDANPPQKNNGVRDLDMGEKISAPRSQNSKG